MILTPCLLEAEQKKSLALSLTPITAHGFMRDISSESAFQGMFQDVYEHVVDCDRLAIYAGQDSNPVAFIASGSKIINGENLFHLGGIILFPEVQGNGFAYSVLREEIETSGATALAFHTQSRLMQKLGSKIAEYDPDLAIRVSDGVGTNNLCITPNGPIDKSRYGGNSLYGDIEKFDPIAIKQPGFNYLEGDAIVYAGRIRRKY